MTKRILMVGTYPIANAKHGGQKRVKAIYELYKRANIGEVRYASSTIGQYYPYREKYDVSVTEKTLKKLKNNPHISDVICGMAIYEDEKVKKHFKELIDNFKPDIIEIEQAYAFMGLRLLLDEMNYSCILINSTQNIEYVMKKDMYKNYEISSAVKSLTLKNIEDTERYLAQNAHINVAVSIEDKLYMQKNYGAKNIILAPNGMNTQIPNDSYVKKWEKHFYNRRIEHTILFVGSGHMPNMTGFMSMIGKKIGFIPKNTRLVIVGGVSDLIFNNLQLNSIEDVCFPLRVELLGQRSEEDLVALLSISDMIILPIVQGGGSNLKTAEALLSYKPIVATRHAFRGYDKYANLEGVYITDSELLFKNKILENLNNSKSKEYKYRYGKVNDVLWDKTLVTLIQSVSQL